MAAHLATFIDIESAAAPTSPTELPTAVKKSNTVTISPEELDALTFGTRYNGPSTSNKPSETQRPTLSRSNTGQTPLTPYTGSQTPHPLLMDDDPAHGAASLVPSWSYPHMNKWRVLAGGLICFGNGINDSAPGALIPYIQEYYSIGYAVVSMIFVTQAIGFITAAFFNELLMTRLGRSRTLLLAEVIMIIGCILIVVTPPFPVVVVAYFCIGYAEATNLAVVNLFCANLAGSTIILGCVHGAYGVGGIFGPIIATVIVSSGILWSRNFFLPLGLRVLIAAAGSWAFKGYEQEAPSQFRSALERTAALQTTPGTGEAVSKGKQLLKAVKNKVTPLGALFIFAYQGAEVAISGWVISYLINYRQGDPTKVGYVTAGFWGGITLGRFFLSPLAQRVGERPFVAALVVGAIAFQLLTWLLPSLIADSIAVSIVGLLLGPVYPCATTVFARVLPREIQTTSISFIASAGSSGGAIAPFLTGLLAQAKGTYVLHPVCISLFAVMIGVWFTLPRPQKRRE